MKLNTTKFVLFLLIILIFVNLLPLPASSIPQFKDNANGTKVSLRAANLYSSIPCITNEDNLHHPNLFFDKFHLFFGNFLVLISPLKGSVQRYRAPEDHRSKLHALITPHFHGSGYKVF